MLLHRVDVVGDEAGVLEDLEVLGHCRPAQGQRRRQLADGLGPLGKAQDDGPAAAVSERTEPLVDFVRHHER